MLLISEEHRISSRWEPSLKIKMFHDSLLRPKTYPFVFPRANPSTGSILTYLFL